MCSLRFASLSLVGTARTWSGSWSEFYDAKQRKRFDSSSFVLDSVSAVHPLGSSKTSINRNTCAWNDKPFKIPSTYLFLCFLMPYKVNNNIKIEDRQLRKRKIFLSQKHLPCGAVFFSALLRQAILLINTHERLFSWEGAFYTFVFHQARPRVRMFNGKFLNFHFAHRVSWDRLLLTERSLRVLSRLSPNWFSQSSTVQ